MEKPLAVNFDISLPIMSGLFAADPGIMRSINGQSKKASKFKLLIVRKREDVHMLKCATYCASDIPPLPTSSMSKSFQPPLAEYEEIVACIDIICVTEHW